MSSTFDRGRALRTETTLNNPKDFYVNKDIANLPFVQQLGRQINRRLLDAQQVSFSCTLSAQSLERLVLPTVNPDGQPAPALRLGQPRVMALLNALTSFVHIPQGLTNRPSCIPVSFVQPLPRSTRFNLCLPQSMMPLTSSIVAWSTKSSRLRLVSCTLNSRLVC